MNPALLIAAVMWFVIATVFYVDLGDQENVIATQLTIIEEQKQMIERDNIIISRMLHDTPDETVIIMWERELPVYSRWYTISNDEKVHAFTQHPDPDKFYQLSY